MSHVPRPRSSLGTRASCTTARGSVRLDPTHPPNRQKKHAAIDATGTSTRPKARPGYDVAPGYEQLNQRPLRPQPNPPTPPAHPLDTNTTQPSLLPEPPQLNTHESAELNTHESFRPCWCATAGTPRTDDPGVGRRLKTHVGDASCRAGRLARVARLLRPAPPAPTQPTNPPTHPHDTNTTQPSLLQLSPKHKGWPTGGGAVPPCLYTPTAASTRARAAPASARRACERRGRGSS